jgi:pilus assembly protein CpaD
MQNVRTMIAASRSTARLAIRTAIVAGCAFVICGCNTEQPQVAAVPDVPTDYRLRHPIAISEADHSLEIFIGSNRGELSAAQRAEVLEFAQTWKREATGGVLVNVPLGTGNERAAAEVMPAIRSILTASGVPPAGIVVRGYHPPGRSLATIHITYPRMAAQAGPCGLWPQDIGPSMNRDFFENQPPWNFGCATQRNLAAMVDNPADLVQPRGETPADTTRRTTVMDNYRLGNVKTATQYPTTDTARIATVSSGQ